MVEPLGDEYKDGGLGKRPAQTIEGTATEISVEPSAGQSAAGESAPEESATAESARAETSPHEPDPDKSASSSAAEQATDAGAPGSAKSARQDQPVRTSQAELKGFFTNLAAGVLGGLIGVLGAALFWGGPGERTQTPALGGLEQRLAKLESEPASFGEPGAVAGLDQRLKALEERKPEPQAELSALDERMAKLESSIQSLAGSGVGTGGDSTAVDARIGEIEQRMDAKVEQALGEQDEAHGKSLEAVEAEIAGLKAKLGALAEAKLEQEDTDRGPELAAIEERIGKVETVIPKLAEAVEQGNANAQSAAATIAYANLREAVDSGRPFAAELDAFNAVASDPGDLGVLEARAQSGIPTLPDLAQALTRASEQAASATAGQQSADASFIDTVIASAKSAVQVKRLDADTNARGPEATVSRAEQALAKNDLAAAIKEVESLPEPSRETFAPWLEDARARRSAGETLAELEGRLLSSLGVKPGEAKP